MSDKTLENHMLEWEKIKDIKFKDEVSFFDYELEAMKAREEEMNNPIQSPTLQDIQDSKQMKFVFTYEWKF